MRAALTITASVLSLASPASAAQVSLVMVDGCAGDAACSKSMTQPPVAVIQFTDTAGEANRVSATFAAGAFTITDAGPALKAGTGCTAVDERRVTCPAQSRPVYGTFPDISVALGGADDTLNVDGSFGGALRVDGGDGADTITAGSGNDVIDGGRGDDRLEGGLGQDTLDYFDRSVGVTVSLALGTAGQAGERDAVSGFERVDGGTGADVITGGSGRDLLYGHRGHDRIAGAGGSDIVQGGIGGDVVSGGAGDDSISTDPEQGDGLYTTEFTPGRDLADGGAGDDEIVDGAGGADTLRGASGDDTLTASSGPDRLFGGAGDDTLDGGAGTDWFDAGTGNDRIEARDRRSERVLCGAGRDRGRFDRSDRLSDCELRLR